MQSKYKHCSVYYLCFPSSVPLANVRICIYTINILIEIIVRCNANPRRTFENEIIRNTFHSLKVSVYETFSIIHFLEYSRIIIKRMREKKTNK